MRFSAEDYPRRCHGLWRMAVRARLIAEQGARSRLLLVPPRVPLRLRSPLARFRPRGCTGARQRL